MKKPPLLIAFLLGCLVTGLLVRHCEPARSVSDFGARPKPHPLLSEKPGEPETDDDLPPTTAVVSPPSVAAVFSTPIVFYGRVQDQYGAPVADAKIAASVADKFGGGSSKLTTRSDIAGKFLLSSAGMTISVRVSKRGYLAMLSSTAGDAPKSSAAFDYGADLGGGIHRPDPGAPVIFTLFKLPAAEPLNRIGEKETIMPKNGEAVQILLDAPGHALELKFHRDDANPQQDGRYAWKLEVSVVGGGLRHRSDRFDFTAPANGYQQTDLMEMPITLKRPEWQDEMERSYWIRFNDGLYGAIKVRMIAGGDHYSIVSGHVNPKQGSQNLAPSSSEQE